MHKRGGDVNKRGADVHKRGGEAGVCGVVVPVLPDARAGSVAVDAHAHRRSHRSPQRDGPPVENNGDDPQLELSGADFHEAVRAQAELPEVPQHGVVPVGHPRHDT